MTVRLLAGWCLVLALLLGGAAAQSKRRVEGPFPAKAGEICVICYTVLDTTGIAYLIDGRRFTVDAGESGEFLEDPDTHIRAFEEHQAKQRRASMVAPGAAIALAAGTALIIWLRRRRRIH